MPSLVYPSKQIVAERYILSLHPMLYLPLWKRDGLKFCSEDAGGYVATVTGAVHTTQGRKFDGVDDRISLGNVMGNVVFPTVVVWINLNTLTGSKSVAVKTGAAPYYYYGITCNAGKFRMNITSGGVLYTCLSEQNAALSRWVHVAGLYNKQQIRVIIDGILQSTATALTGAVDVGTTSFSVGSWEDGSEAADSTIGEVLVCDNALSLSEIQKHYALTKWRYQ